MTTVLLDLNYTLCQNSEERVRHLSRYSEWLKKEVYREWLVEYCRMLGDLGHKIVLITARPQKWQEQTLARIYQSHRWRPDVCYFKDDRALSPHKYKEGIARELLQSDPSPDSYVGFESNNSTRKAYKKLGIHAVKVPDDVGNAPLHQDPLLQALRWSMSTADHEVIDAMECRGHLVRRIQERKAQRDLPFLDAEQAQHVVLRAQEYAGDIGCTYASSTVQEVFRALCAGAQGIRDSIGQS